MFKKEGINAVLLKHNIDSPFITRLEQKNPDVKFVRIDSDLTDSFKEETSDEEKETLKKDSESLTALFHKALNNDKLTVKAEKLKDASMACVMTLSEEGRSCLLYTSGLHRNKINLSYELFRSSHNPNV